MDISSDFFALTQQLESEVPPGSQQAKTETTKNIVNHMRDFHVVAGQISKDVHLTSQRLSKLTKLVKHRSLFNDPVDEINMLVHSIKEDLTHLNVQLEAAQTHADSNKRLLGQKNQAALHSAHVVTNLKLETNQAAQNFKKILQERSESMRAQAARKGAFGAAGPGGGGGGPGGGGRGGAGGGGGGRRRGPAVAERARPALYGPPAAGGGASPLLPRPGAVTSLPASEQQALESAMGDTAPLLGGGGGGVRQRPGAQQQQQQLQLIPDQTYFEERATVMTEVESQILELGTIFNKLGLMVQEQRDLVERLEDNVEDTHQNVSLAHMKLMQVYDNLRSNRALAMKIFGILIVFFTMFIIFLA